MTTIKIGTFPGRVEEFALESTTTVSQALEIANIELSDEQQVKLDDMVVNGDTAIGNASTLLVTKRLKGNK